MEFLEKIGDFFALVFGGIGRKFERLITSIFGSSNARYIKRLQPQVDAINAIEDKYVAMSEADMVLATLPEAAPARKKCLAVSCPAPISARVP